MRTRRPISFGSLVLFASTLALSQCLTPATEVLVVIDSNAPLGRPVVVSASVVAADEAVSDASFDYSVVRPADGGALPASFAVVPGSTIPENADVLLTIQVYLGSAPGLSSATFRRRALFTFTPHAQTTLRFFLNTACARAATGCHSVSAAACTESVLCEEIGQTCGDDGSCTGLNVMPALDGGADAHFDDIALDASDVPPTFDVPPVIDTPPPRDIPPPPMDVPPPPVDTGPPPPVDSGTSPCGPTVSCGANCVASDARPSIVNDATGMMVLVARAADNEVLIKRQVPGGTGAWCPWQSLGGSAIGNQLIVRNSDGRVEVFALGWDHALCHKWETTPGGSWAVNWSCWPGSFSGDPVGALNSNNGLEIFDTDTSGALWHVYQSSPNGPGWVGPLWLGNGFAGSPGLGQNVSGTLEVFVRGTDRAIHHLWQVPGSSTGWSNWASLGGALISDPAVGSNSDGRLELFARGTNAEMFHIWQMTAGGAWSNWSGLASDVGLGPAAVSYNFSLQTLELYVTDGDDQIYHIYQTAPHAAWVGQWFSLGGSAPVSPAVATNVHLDPEIFVRGNDGYIDHNWRNASGWNGFVPLY